MALALKYYYHLGVTLLTMQIGIIILCLLVILWLTFFYVWHLTWPEVTAKVTSVDIGVSKGIGINRPRKYHLINYTYEYEGVSYKSRRQGLIAARAFAPQAEVGDIIQVRVCRIFRSLSCPSRVGFEVKVLLFSTFILIIAASVIYVLPPL